MTALPRADRLGLLLGFSVLALVVALDAALDIALSGASAAVAAVITAAMASPRSTALVASAVVAQSALSGLWNHNFWTQEWSLRLGFAVVVSGVAIGVAVIRTRREQALSRMTVIAEAAQRAILRSMPTSVDSVTFAARYVSATQDALIGGDLYEVVRSPYGVRVIVGDVRGKGLAAVQMASTVLTSFRQLAPVEASLTHVAQRLDEMVTAVGDDEEFVTLVMAEFHDDHTVSLVNCGHHGPLLVRSDGTAIMLDPQEPTAPLGLHPAPTVQSKTWPEDARMLLYTDGLVEARNRAGDFFPLMHYAADLQDGSVEQAIDRLIGHLLTHAGGDLSDDMALVVAAHTPG